MPNLLFILSPEQDAETLQKVTHATQHSAEVAGLSSTLCSWENRFDHLSGGNYDTVVFLGKDVLLEPRAVSGLISHLSLLDDNAVVYADVNSLRLPDFSPQRLLCQNYVSQLIAVSGSLLETAGGLDPQLTSSAAVYDLVLRLSLQNQAIIHLPEVLAHTISKNSQEISSTEIEESRQALISAREARGGGEVGEYLGDRVFYSRGKVVGDPLVSIVIPTRALSHDSVGAQGSLVVNAVKSIVELTDYSNYEIVAVVDAGADREVMGLIEELAGPRLKVVWWNKPFNFSQKMNYGVLHARGEYVLLLNDDVKVLSASWLRSMLVLAQFPNAGMAGAMLYYEDDTIQHAGHAYYQGSPTHIGLELPRGSRGPDSGFLVEREVSGVTAACALMPMEVFKKVGGFTALLPGNFNDVDLCLKVGWLGYDIYWTPDAQLYHYESKTRDAHVHYYELDVIEHRWGLRLDDSRYWPHHPAAAN